MKSTSASRSENRTVLATRIGAAAWIAATAQFFIGQLVVEAAWRTPYSWVSNNISDLGNVHCQTWDVSRPRYVCSPLHDVMNTSFVVHGVLLLVGTLLTGACWGQGWLSRTARLLFVINAGGWVLVGLVPADINEDLHVLGALLIMGLGNIGLICAGFVPRDSLFGQLRFLTLFFAAAAVAAAWMFFSQQDPGTGLGSLERIAAFALSMWTLVMGLAIFRGSGFGADRVTDGRLRWGGLGR
ncbi:DUF998 domain-containing protein [Streptomyces sp. ISL-98]|uniref:DUF998 domain-containing protein n=1 Tax=Streptomyces sp. ISL-98 TaxID=2819192 RepID=UPI001BE572C8|nr:DUF998 domain-containing protein [Streptomyces sp. ISL-98]MBT2507706.1 DUF998 domain-containing protein [Streptomyces sp. ISL-98]